MDKTIEVVLVAAITIVAASILLIMVQGESSDVTDSFDSLISGSECSSMNSKWKTAVKNGNSGKASRIKSDANSKGCETGTWQRPSSSGGSGSGCPSGYSCLDPGLCSGDTAGSCDLGVCCAN